ncbi:DUF6510 family protein [Streptomyces sp. NPDC005708]|uniref:DUF6510 family protein n=1 Tax=Streptomyces sp. NPDC005708 TaxID=3154564 RepID=UPI0033EAEF33
MSAGPHRSSRRRLPTWCSWDMHLSECVPSASATVEVEMASVEASGPDVDDTHAGYADGNALAGPLSAVFAVDVTAATSRCANCGCTAPPCSPACVQARTGPCRTLPAVREGHAAYDAQRDTVWLDMSGAASLAIPLGEI